MTKQEQINEQIEMASKVRPLAGWVAIITETKLSKKARKSHIGFRFEKEENAKIGRIIENGDGSISAVVAIA